MNELNTIIIDDDPGVRETLLAMIDRLDMPIRILGEAENIHSGLKLIREKSPNLVLLDVELPDGHSFELLQALEDITFEIIFITGYNKYALEAIKHSALDYLIKPFTINELKNGLIKAKERLFASIRPSLDPLQKRITLPTNFGLTIVQIDQIIYCKGDSSYTTFMLPQQKKIVVSSNLKEFERKLCPPSFLRIHKTYLVNINHVVNYLKGRGGQVEMSNGDFLDVSRQKRQELIDILLG